MKMSNQEIKSFLNAVDNAKLKMKPLPESYIAGKLDDYIKGLYATILASLLVGKGVISDEENRLFRLILDSIGLEEDVSYFVNNVSQMTSKQVLDLLENLDSDDKRLNLLFEALLLTRIYSPITDTQLQVLDEICSLFELEQDDIKLLVFWLEMIMGLDNRNIQETINEIPRDYIYKATQTFEVDKSKIFVKPYAFVIKDTILGDYLRKQRIIFSEKFKPKRQSSSGVRLISIGSLLSALNGDEITEWNFKENDKFLKHDNLVLLKLRDYDSTSSYSVKAPFDGVMTKIYKQNEERISENDVLCTIIEQESARQQNKIRTSLSGILIDIKQNSENHIEYQILPLPNYLSNWADSIKTLMEG